MNIYQEFTNKDNKLHVNINDIDLLDKFDEDLIKDYFDKLVQNNSNVFTYNDKQKYINGIDLVLAKRLNGVFGFISVYSDLDYDRLIILETSKEMEMNSSVIKDFIINCFDNCLDLNIKEDSICCN